MALTPVVWIKEEVKQEEDVDDSDLQDDRQKK
jgi:hypothetical protein